MKWITGRKSDNYVSADTRNELLKVMASRISRDIASVLKQTSFFAISVDKSTDFANKEQVVICLRWVDDNLHAHEECIGLYEIDNISAATLVYVIKDTLLRMNLSLARTRGQCYDWAANTSGAKSGVAKRLSDEEPRAVFTQCYGHALNLACSDA